MPNMDARSWPGPPAGVVRVVVLMLENQSFDRLLGFLPGIGDLAETAPSQLSLNGEIVPATADADALEDHTWDPPHSHATILEQMWGPDRSAWPFEGNDSVLPPHGKEMLAAAVKAAPGREQQFMRCFAPGSLPAMHTLAREFVTCDQYHSSVPGATGPNRLLKGKVGEAKRPLNHL